MPSRKVVESRMVLIFKNNKKQARDAAQNDAARCLARAARKAGVDNGDDDEVMSDDEASDSEEGGGDAATAAASNSAEVDPAEVHYAQLACFNVSTIRQLLREERGESTPLTHVAASDLSAQDPKTREEKSRATLKLLRQRLAAVYLENEALSTPPSSTQDMDSD